jgi:ABC-type multidrug transport system ATPase subunit
MVGFLGPNGAGKTTTLKMLSGRQTPHWPARGILYWLHGPPPGLQPSFLRS